MNEKLLAEIKKIADLSDEDLIFFKNSLEKEFIPKGEHFLKEGQICKHLGIVTEGLLMYYKIIDGEEIPADFSIENEWVSYLKSLSSGSPSDMAIKALEDTHLYTLSVEKMSELFSIQPKFMSLRNYYTEISFIKNTEHTVKFTAMNAKQRYYKLMEERAELINRVPQYYIAAYLGIKPQSLSRLRK